MRKEDVGFVERARSVHVAEATMTAPRLRVFDAFVDPEGWPDWFPNVQRATYTSPPPFGVGTIRAAQVGGTRWVEEMIAWDDGRRWAWTVLRASVPFAKAQVECFEFADAGAGTHIRWTLALEPRLVARLGTGFATGAIRRLLARATANLDARLNGASGAMTTLLVQVREPLVRRIADALPDVEVVSIPSEGDLPLDVRGEVVLTMAWGSPNLAQVLARGVRWVHALGTGVDRFPFELLGDRPLTCSRGASAIPIAEWVLAMMLAFEKRVPDLWIHDVPTKEQQRMHLGSLYGRTLGLVGVGGIGAAVAERARPFGMRMRAFRRRSQVAGPASVEIVDSITELVASSDHVVIAAPATSETRGLFDDALFGAMKPGAHLVNIARGAIVDPDALRRALDAGRVALASLDAVEPEPLPAGHWMYGDPRVRLSPHISWSMPGAAEILVDSFIDNVRRWQRGEPLDGIVDREARY